MVTLEDVRKEYDRLDKIYGIDTNFIKLEEFFDSKKLTVGSCWFNRITGLPYKITFNKYYLQNMPDYDYYDVMRHEYAHAIAKYLYNYKGGHGRTWQEICLKIGCRPSPYTYNLRIVEPLISSQVEGVKKYKVKCLRCEDCTYHDEDSRIVKVLKSGRMAFNYKCSKCGGRLFELVNCPLPKNNGVSVDTPHS